VRESDRASRQSEYAFVYVNSAKFRHRAPLFANPIIEKIEELMMKNLGECSASMQRNIPAAALAGATRSMISGTKPFGGQMKRKYVYRGFEVTVKLDPIWTAIEGVSLSSLRGFVAIVDIRKLNSTHPIVAPIRLTESSQRPFAMQGDALMAGCSAGQRLVDDAFFA
jgi:hypothetical protein